MLRKKNPSMATAGRPTSPRVTKLPWYNYVCSVLLIFSAGSGHKQAAGLTPAVILCSVPNENTATNVFCL